MSNVSSILKAILRVDRYSLMTYSKTRITILFSDFHAPNSFLTFLKRRLYWCKCIITIIIWSLSLLGINWINYLYSLRFELITKDIFILLNLFRNFLDDLNILFYQSLIFDYFVFLFNLKNTLSDNQFLLFDLLF